MVRMLAKSLIKDPLGLRYYGPATLYAVAAYVLGFAGLFSTSWAVSVPATLLLAHGMIIAAYMIHECGHNMVFNHSRHNAYLGRFMSWLCGAAYGTYEDMRYKHFRHHVDNDDVVWLMSSGSITMRFLNGTPTSRALHAFLSGSIFRRKT
jgi:fatty acid desaturase